MQLIAIGGAIGTGLFMGSGTSISLAGPSILFSYLIVGVICFLIMRALGELLLSNLKYGTFIEFILDYMGPTAAFVTGWTYWLCWLSIAMADLTAVGIYIQFWLPSIPQWVPPLIALIILMGMNLATVELFGEMEFWFALIKIVAIIALILIGTFLIFKKIEIPGGHASFSNLWSHGGFFPNGMKGFILSFQMVVFAFVGLELVGLTAAETANPEKVLPVAINNIPIRIIIFYVGALTVIMGIFPWDMASPNHSPFVQVFSVAGIVAAASVINFVVLTSAASACNSALFSTSRMLYSLSKCGDAPENLGRLNSKTKVPQNALFLSSAVILTVVFLNYVMPEGVFQLVTSVSSVCFIMVWSMIVICHLKYRKADPEVASKSIFKMPLYPFSNYLILAFMVFVIIVLALVPATRIALIATAVWFIALYLVARSYIAKKLGH